MLQSLAHRSTSLQQLCTRRPVTQRRMVVRAGTGLEIPSKFSKVGVL